MCVQIIVNTVRKILKYHIEITNNVKSPSVTLLGQYGQNYSISYIKAWLLQGLSHELLNGMLK